MLEAKSNVNLSDSPLVPWPDKMQFFALTPMSKPTRASSLMKLSRSIEATHIAYQEGIQIRTDIIPVNLSPRLDTCAVAIQDTSQSANSPSVKPFDQCVASKEKKFARKPTPYPKRALHADVGITPVNLCVNVEKNKSSRKPTPYPKRVPDKEMHIIPGNPAPAMHKCLESFSNMYDPIILSSAGSLKSHLSEEEEENQIEDSVVPVVNTPARTMEELNENLGVGEIVTPMAFQSLVKRYSNFADACDRFSDSSPLPLATPATAQKQDTNHGPMENEFTDITEYFTAFSPPRSLTLSLLSVNSSPQEKEGPDASHAFPNGETSDSLEDSINLSSQSLMKRYSEFLSTEEEKEGMTDLDAVLAQMLVISPPKTCILMQDNDMESTMKSRKSIQTPLPPPKSPFRTPGLQLMKLADCAFYEDMDLASMKRPGEPPRPPESVRMTPSSDMQFATIKKALGSIKRTPLADLQLSTVRKPGAPLPGEQTLKRELWSRMEAEFASMANVCKSLFTDGSQTEALAIKVEKIRDENRPPRSNFLHPRQHRD
ncbi:hypothetical protein KP509_13G083600 [Ceratopteris richardii]|nr:hypothetical protein KP509_13G083600 [Ceratopteris richardii]KAH7421962.1 hypothetical protein KP509_13G083600 [Ceratopteris richardii]